MLKEVQMIPLLGSHREKLKLLSGLFTWYFELRIYKCETYAFLGLLMLQVDLTDWGEIFWEVFLEGQHIEVVVQRGTRLNVMIAIKLGNI